MQTTNAKWALGQLRKGATAPIFGWRARPELVVLGPRAGVTPSEAPAVRIFVGTEPAQDRIERVFVWSIERVRDPARTYEIYLMKELAGFDQRRWLTGFTNYRLAIPHMAGGKGRAIYNDCDQVYLVDPALLFDLDMGPHGFMSINDHDSSVMLLDCARMIQVWSLDDARYGKRKELEAKARAIPEMWGQIDPGWNARDEEYDPSTSKCVHFTTIHTQPWLPFPERFVYQRNPIASLFDGLERSADEAAFQLFSEESPSSEYRALVGQLQVARTYDRNGSTSVLPPASPALTQEDIGRPGQSLLDFSFAAPPGSSNGALANVTFFDPTRAGGNRLAGQQFDTVACRTGLELVPSQDVPWVLDILFRHARANLHAIVRISQTTVFLPGGTTLHSRPRGVVWWKDRFQNASLAHPHVRWRLELIDEGADNGAGRRVVEGGRLPEPPRVWVLADDKTGHTVQSVGLADALGWPYEVKRLEFNVLNRLSNQILDARIVSVKDSSRPLLNAPWPDLVISTGRRTAPVARWIAMQSGGHTRLVQLGRKGGELPDDFDVVVSCAHFRLPQHRSRIDVAAPLNTLTPETISAARARWEPVFAGSPHPWITLVIGGSTANHELTPALAGRIARDVRAFAEQAGGRVFAITSPRTGVDACEAIAAALGDAHHLHRWQPGEAENPYFGFLALGDVIVVTGESESMLSEASTIGAPVYIYPIPERAPGLRQRLREWVTERAYSRPRKKNKGTVRPQQGIEKFCAQLIARGIVRPPRQLTELHDALVQSGAAHRFGEPLTTERHAGVREIERVAERVRGLFGFPPATRGDA